MEKIDALRLIIEVVLAISTVYFGYTKFKYKNSLVTILKAAKDNVVTEEEFQEIADTIKKDIYGDAPVE